MNKFYVIIYHPSRFGVIPHDILTTHYQILHIIVETLAIVQMRLTWIWAGCIRNYIATYLALRRDASVITSGRTRCYVGTQFREQHWSVLYVKKLSPLALAVAVPQSGHEKARKKRVHHELMVHPPKTTNNFTKLITYQSSSFCLPASLLHPM